MSDFHEKAGEEGFSDEVEYLDYLISTVEGPSSDDIMEYQKHYEMEYEMERAELLETKKIALSLINILNISKSRGFPVDFNLDNIFISSENEDLEVVRNLSIFCLTPGDILKTIYTPKSQINKYNELFKRADKDLALYDDIYFTKHIEKHKLDVWVGSPKENSAEKDKLIKMITEGIRPSILITSLLNECQFTYCIIGGKKVNLEDIEVFPSVDDVEEF